MVDMAFWDSLERAFHEEFKNGIVRVIQWVLNILAPVVKGLKLIQDKHQALLFLLLVVTILLILIFLCLELPVFHLSCSSHSSDHCCFDSEKEKKTA